MSSRSSYGQPLFLKSLEPATVPEALSRLDFAGASSAGNKQYDESWLQNFVFQHPGVLPIAQIEPAFDTPISVCMELPVKSGFVDVLFVTAEGDLIVVECKLWRNPEARRAVIAQILDYASDIAAWTYEALEKAVGFKRNPDNPQRAREFKLYDLVAEKGILDEVGFHEAVSRNLKRGRFLLLIVGDGIQQGVENLTDFLHSTPDSTSVWHLWNWLCLA